MNTIKRTCDGCKALKGDHCEFNYKVKKIYSDLHNEIVVNLRPLENCPKPKTIKAYLEIWNKYN